MRDDNPRFPNLEANYVIKLFEKIKRQNIKIMDLTIEELTHRLDINETITYFTLLKEMNKVKDDRKFKLHNLNISDTKQNKFKLEYEEINPYKTLGLVEGEYTKEELLQAMGKRIKEEQLSSSDKSKINDRIDKILDSYNELIKEMKKK